MGHLVNPISSQLKHHGSWKITWSQFFRRDFAYFFFIDQYIKSLVSSLTLLKSFFNKFFFYELKYFLKNNLIFFYFSFKFLRKTAFKFYWKYIYNSRLLSRFISFSRKKKKQRKLEKILSRSQFVEIPMEKKLAIFEKYKSNLPNYLLNNVIIKSKNSSFKIDFFLRKFVLLFKLINLKIFNLILSLYSKFYIYQILLHFFFKQKNMLLMNIFFVLNTKVYGKTSVFSLNSCKYFPIVRGFFSKVSFLGDLKTCLMSSYLYKNNFYYIESQDIDTTFLIFNESTKMMVYSKTLVQKIFLNFGKLLFRKFKLGSKVSRTRINIRLKVGLKVLVKRLIRFSKETKAFINRMNVFLRSKIFKNFATKKNILNFSTEYKKNMEPISWFGDVLTNYNG